MEKIKKHWQAILTCINTFLCVLTMCWCIIVPAVDKWEDVYLIRTTSGYEYVSENGYSAIKVKKEGQYIIIKYYLQDGTIYQTKTERTSVLYIDYV